MQIVILVIILMNLIKHINKWDFKYIIRYYFRDNLEKELDISFLNFF